MCNCIGTGAESSLVGFPSLAWLQARERTSETLPRDVWFERQAVKTRESMGTEENGAVLHAEVVTSQICCIVFKLRLLYGGHRDSVLYGCR